MAREINNKLDDLPAPLAGSCRSLALLVILFQLAANTKQKCTLRTASFNSRGFACHSLGLAEARDSPSDNRTTEHSPDAHQKTYLLSWLPFFLLLFFSFLSTFFPFPDLDLSFPAHSN